MTVWAPFVARAGLVDPDLRSTVLALSRIPYGRPAIRSADGVVAEWRGTCSTKHVLLDALFREQWPSTDVELWHRIYTLTPEMAEHWWGPQVAEIVPATGLVDVHTYATARVGVARVPLDVTFAVTMWDGRSPMEIASGPGEDHRAGTDPLARKEQLVSLYCDPPTREPFIAALTRVLGDGR